MSAHDNHDLGLAADLSTLRAQLNRRRLFGVLGGVGLVTIAGCGSDGGATATTSAGATGTSAGTASSSGTTSGTAASGAAAVSCEEIPEETAGPYPGDGSNGPNVLTESGIVRSDIRSSFGSASGVAEGVPLTIRLTVLDTRNGCAPFAGAAVYLWHCDINGGYSMYSREIADQNYLRGVQAADGSGALSFTSIFPAAYSGRWPHIHFEVYPSLDDATSQSDRIATSQLALPQDVCDAVYATDGYATSVRNLAQTSLDSDMVFRDGYRSQLATVTGSVADGYTATLPVAV